MAEQIVDLMEANMPASSDVVAAARSAAGAVALDALSGKVDKTGVGQVTMQNLSQEVKEALTGGSVAVVGENSVGYAQLDTPRQESMERLLSQIEITTVSGKSWQVNTAGTAAFTNDAGWTGVSVDFPECVVDVETLSTHGNLPGVLFIDAQFKVLASWCRGEAVDEIHSWTDRRFTAPPGTAHVLVNAYDAAASPARVRVWGWSAEAPAERTAGDYGNVDDFQGGLLSGIGDLSCYYGATTTNSRFGFQTTQDTVNGGYITPALHSSSNMVLIHVKGESEIPRTQILVRQSDSEGSYTFKTIKAIEPAGSFDVWAQYDANSAGVYEGMSSFSVFVQGTKGPGRCWIDEFEVCEKTPDGCRGNALYRPRLDEQLAAIFDRLDQTGDGGGSAPDPTVLVSPDGTRWSLTVSDDGMVGAVSHTPSSVLFMGNSLLLGMDTNNEHGGAFGLCAASPKADFAWHVEQAIKQRNPSCTFDKLHCAAFEQSENDTTAQEYITRNAARWAGKDLVIIQIGDNANNDTRRATFARNLPSLLASIRAGSPRARVILVGIWFTHADNVATLQSACARYGCMLVRIDDLDVRANQAPVGQLITYADGTTITAQDNWVTHPGDQGMQAIADRIITAFDM